MLLLFLQLQPDIVRMDMKLSSSKRTHFVSLVDFANTKKNLQLVFSLFHLNPLGSFVLMVSHDL